MSQKYSLFLYRQDCVKGEMFNLTAEQIEEYKADGWLDSPESLDIPEEPISVEEVESMSPDGLIKKVEGMGFIVMSPEQLKAEANKMASVVLDIGKFDDEVIEAEYNNRFNTETKADESNVVVINSDIPLINRFLANPDSLSEDELVELGSDYKLGLRKSFSRDTMVAKLNEAISQG